MFLQNGVDEIGDALEYLQKDALKGKTNTVFIDIASEDQGAKQIPPENFLDENFFTLLFEALSPTHHVILFNTCCYSEAERDSIYEKVNGKFKYCAYIDCSESSNRVYILSNTHAPNLAKTSENTIKYFVKTFCDSKNADGHSWATGMNMKELLEGMVYGSGKKTEVKIEQVESGLKKKKKQKK